MFHSVYSMAKSKVKAGGARRLRFHRPSVGKVVRCDPITGQIRARGKFNYISVKCERFLFQSESPVHGCVDPSRLIFSPTSVLVGGDAGRYGATRLAGNVKAKGSIWA